MSEIRNRVGKEPLEVSEQIAATERGPEGNDQDTVDISHVTLPAMAPGGAAHPPS